MRLIMVIGLLLVGRSDPLVHVGTFSDSLRSPARVSVAVDGTVYVTDLHYDHIARFDAAGTFLGTWPVPEGPIGVAAHSDGRFFVSLRDATNPDQMVAIYDDTFTLVGYLGDGDPLVNFVRPTDIDIDTDTGNIYVVDAEGDRVYGFASDGSVALIVGIRGGGAGEFRYPSAITVDEGNGRLIVADHDNFRVQAFTTGGIFQTHFGYRLKFIPGEGSQGWLPRTQGLAVDSAGRIYVADALMSTVRVFDPTGEELAKVLEYGFDPGDLRTPCDLALNPDGTRLYVVSTNTSSVEVYETPDWRGSPPPGGKGGKVDNGSPGTNWSDYDLMRLGVLQPTIGNKLLPEAHSDNGSLFGRVYDGPHMIDAPIICGRCHGFPDLPGGYESLVEGQQVLCFSCHSSGGQGLEMPGHELDLADPYGTNPSAADNRGISHAWGVPVVSSDADSVGPAIGSPMALYVDNGNLKCATCHNQHQAFYAPYLRMSNAGDAMCKECHAPRNEGLGERGTHPVGFDYPGGEGEFPADGAVSPLLLKSDNVECLTCHALHNATSGDVNNGEGDGMLLRAANDETLCQVCHADHLGHSPGGDWQPSCNDCHDVHDPESENLTLVSRTIFGTPITFLDNDPTGNNLTDFIHSNHDPVSYDGVCEVCHTETAHHRNNPDGDHSHYADQRCVDCHPHNAGFMPTGGSCTDCHGQPPDGQPPVGDVFPNRAGSHAAHMSDARGPQITDCFVCHAALSGGTHSNGFVSFASGVDLDENGNIDLNETDTCDACHSPGGAFDGVNDIVIGAKANWSDGVYDGDALRSGKETWCAGCHDEGISTVNGVSAPPVAGDNATWGYYSSGHGQSGVVACSDCHDFSVEHTDGVAHTYVAASDNYQTAFRLSDVNGGPPLLVPRFLPDVLDAYDDPPYWELCFKCHNKYALIGGPDAPAGPYYSDEFSTNFRSESSVIIPDGLDTDIAEYSIGGAADVNSHYQHLAGPPHFVDSDHDGENDSFGTCVACHNVHGSESHAMVRDGKLIGSEPSLNFGHVRYDRTDPWQPGCESPIIMTSDNVLLAESQGGIMRADSGTNGVCTFCHTGGAGTSDPEYIINCYTPDPVAYYRNPVAVPRGCAMCHASPADNGDGVPPGGRRAVAGEFPTDDAHAHYGVELDSDACVVCHDMTGHKDGSVNLIDADDGSLYTFVTPDDLTSDPDLSDFCSSCHDSDGATRLATPTDPFGNGNAAPDVATRFLGTVQWYEDYFFGGTMRAINSHHDIADADQSFSGAKLECLNCHGSHTSSASQPLVDPYAPLTPWTESGNRFCLSCHNGGNGPADPQFPAGVSGPTIAVRGLGNCDFPDPPGQACSEDCDYLEPEWSVDFPWSIHSHGLGSKRAYSTYYDPAEGPGPMYELNCTDCHDEHGSYTPTNPEGNAYMIRDYVDGTGYIDDGYPGNWYRMPGNAGVVETPIIEISIMGFCESFPQYCSDRPQFENLCIICHPSWEPAGGSHSAWHTPPNQNMCQQCHGHGPFEAAGQWDWDNQEHIQFSCSGE